MGGGGGSRSGGRGQERDPQGGISRGRHLPRMITPAASERGGRGGARRGEPLRRLDWPRTGDVIQSSGSRRDETRRVPVSCSAGKVDVRCGLEGEGGRGGGGGVGGGRRREGRGVCVETGDALRDSCNIPFGARAHQLLQCKAPAYHCPSWSRISVRSTRHPSILAPAPLKPGPALQTEGRLTLD